MNLTEKGALGTVSGWRARVLFAGGALALAIFYVQAAKLSWSVYSDFDQIYMAGLAWLKGLSPYDGHLLPEFSVADGPTNQSLRTYYYSPLCGMLMAPFALMPFPFVVALWKYGLFSLLFFGVWRFIALTCPEVPVVYRWCLLGATALAGSVRWNLAQLQPTALIVTGLLFFAVSVFENRFWRSVALGTLVSIKMTYLLPVAGLLLFRRNYRVLAALALTIGLLNVVSLLRTGPLETIATFRAALSTFEDFGKMTRPDALDFLTPYLVANPSSPLAHLAPVGREPGRWAGEQIHLRYILSAWGFGFGATKVIALILSAGLVAYFAVLWKRLHRNRVLSVPFQGLLFAGLMATCLLVVYHQRYDALALLPCSYVAVSALYRRRSDLVGWCVLGATLTFAYLMSARLLGWWYVEVVVPYGLLALLPICGYLTLVACLGTLALIWRDAHTPVGESLRHDAPEPARVVP